MRLTRSDLISTAAVVVVLLLVAFLADSSTVFLVAAAIPLAIAALGQDLVLNRAGQATFGGAALMAVGAFTVAKSQDLAWLPFPLPLVAAGVVGAVIGVIIGLPGVRVRGLYLLLTTLALQIIVQYAGQRIQGPNIAGIFISVPEIGAYQVAPGRPTLYLGAIVLALTVLVLRNLYATGPGRVWQVIRENEVAARVMGVPTVSWKLSAFVVSSVITAIGGGLFAYTTGNVSSEAFTLTLAIQVVVVVYVGGRRTLIGPMIGALFVGYGPNLLERLQSTGALPAVARDWLTVNGGNLATAIYAVLLLVVFVLDPDGVVGLGQRLRRFLRRTADRPGVPAPGDSSTSTPLTTADRP
ncbi:branched-chain amino acid ABC transporter permease [Dactylosporangium sp. CA-092794]|uniref:branched-chain amino acid ABC transporter permease n=1 Tax=Dactylosporangium sp. CA-092794 TaxID=3239929 RepID=UPI003D8E6E60